MHYGAPAAAIDRTIRICPSFVMGTISSTVVVLPYDASEDFKSLLTARFLVEHIMGRQQPLLAARFARL